jgi:hypothetical protein
VLQLNGEGDSPNLEPRVLAVDILETHLAAEHKKRVQRQLVERLRSANQSVLSDLERFELGAPAADYLRAAGVALDGLDAVMQREIRAKRWSLDSARRMHAPPIALRSAFNDLADEWRRALNRENIVLGGLSQEATRKMAEFRERVAAVQPGTRSRSSSWTDAQEEYIGDKQEFRAKYSGERSSYPRWLMDLQPASDYDYLLPLIEYGASNIVLVPSASGLTYANAVCAAQGIVAEEMARSAPDLLQVAWLDTLDSGKSAGAFLDLLASVPAAFCRTVATDSQAVAASIQAIQKRMSEIQTNCLRSQFATLADYNSHQGSAPEANLIVVATGYPSGFDEKSARELCAISLSGARVGVSVVVVLSPPIASMFEPTESFAPSHSISVSGPPPSDLPEWWSPELLPRGRLILSPQGRPHTLLPINDHADSMLVSCRLRFPADRLIRKIALGYGAASIRLAQWGFSPRGLDRARSSSAARADGRRRAMLVWLADQASAPDWEEFVGARFRHLGGTPYSPHEVAQEASYLYDKDFIDAGAGSADPTGRIFPQLTSRGVDVVMSEGSASGDNFSAAQRRSKQETNINGPVFYGNATGNSLAWNNSGPVSQSHQSSQQIAPGFEDLANAVAQTLARLGQIGLPAEEAEDAEASAREILLEVEKDAPDRGRIRRALAALKTFLLPVANQAAIGASEGAHDFAKAALEHLQSVTF